VWTGSWVKECYLCVGLEIVIAEIQYIQFLDQELMPYHYSSGFGWY